MAKFGVNTISKIEKGGSKLNASVWHSCAQCGGRATEAYPLVEFHAIVDMGKRVARPEEVKFYAHAECLSIETTEVKLNLDK